MMGAPMLGLPTIIGCGLATDLLFDTAVLLGMALSGRTIEAPPTSNRRGFVSGWTYTFDDGEKVTHLVTKITEWPIVRDQDCSGLAVAAEMAEAFAVKFFERPG
jgi:hypothetical protein